MTLRSESVNLNGYKEKRVARKYILYSERIKHKRCWMSKLMVCEIDVDVINEISLGFVI